MRSETIIANDMMPPALNRTHDAGLMSWVESANAEGADFPLQNLPLGVFRDDDPEARIGVAIGDMVFDLTAVSEAGLLAGRASEAAQASQSGTLNALMAVSAESISALRAQVFDLLERSSPERERCAAFLLPQKEVTMLLPAHIGDYTDFYASIHHARRVGAMFRPERPLLPNYCYLPIGYHGRASSIVVSGHDVRRPWGQRAPVGDAAPRFAPSGRLDYELEVGAFVRGNNSLGEAVPIAAAGGRMFGLCLLNDWSARDIQSWEYQPLGPFLAKSFATSISPWVVTAEALLPFRVPAAIRAEDGPAPLPYLTDAADQRVGAFDIRLEVTLTPLGGAPTRLTQTSFAGMYWTFAQMLAHHTGNGCNLRAGDLLGSGTVSGAPDNEAGCLLELTDGGKSPVMLACGGQRAFLLDGDTVTLRGRCARQGFRSIGFGECRGTITAALPPEAFCAIGGEQ